VPAQRLTCPEGFALIRYLMSLKVLRLFRALRLLKIVIASKRGIKPILDVFAKNYLHYITLITISLIIFSGIAFSWLELRVISIQGTFQGV